MTLVFAFSMSLQTYKSFLCFQKNFNLHDLSSYRMMPLLSLTAKIPPKLINVCYLFNPQLLFISQALEVWSALIALWTLTY